MDHLRIMGFLVLLLATLFTVQFAEARVLEHHFHNAALSQHNSTAIFDSDLDAVAVASSTPNYTGAGGHATNYSDSNPGSNSGSSTEDVTITVEFLKKEATPGDGGSSKAPAGIAEVTSIEGNADTLHEILKSESSHMGVSDGIQGNILSSGQSPGVGHREKTKSKYSTSRAGNVLPSGPSPGVGNGHTTVAGGTQSESATFNQLPSGSSPGGGNKVTNGYTEIAQESKSKKSVIMNKLPSGPSPGVGNSATNGHNTMEKTISTEKDEEGLMGIQTFNRLPSGPSPGVGHSYTNAHVTANVKIASASEDRKGSEDAVSIFHKLPGGPSPGGGHSSTVKMQLSSMAPMKTSSSPSPGDGNSSKNKLKPAGGSQKEKVEQTAGALDRKIGCDSRGGVDFYGTPTPPMFGVEI